MIDDDDYCGVVGGIVIGNGNQNTWKKLAPVRLFHHKFRIA
jgi:hypothetical protein